MTRMRLLGQQERGRKKKRPIRDRDRVRVRLRVRVRFFIVTGGHKWVLCVRQCCERKR